KDDLAGVVPDDRSHGHFGIEVEHEGALRANQALRLAGLQETSLEAPAADGAVLERGLVVGVHPIILVGRYDWESTSDLTWKDASLNVDSESCAHGPPRVARGRAARFALRPPASAGAEAHRRHDGHDARISRRRAGGA